MFTIIYPSLFGRHAETMAQIFDTRENFSGIIGNTAQIDPYDTKDTIYISYKKEKLGVVGSCRLNLLKDSPASDLYQSCRISEKDFLEVSLISFTMPEEPCASKSFLFYREQQIFLNGMYQILTEQIRDFGYEGFMCLNKSEDDRNLFFLKSWPFQERMLFEAKDLCEILLVSKLIVQRPCLEQWAG